jgi:hypothetical protein
VHQESEGHCSHSSPSLCTGSAVREYFQTRRLPKQGMVCETEFRPFLGCVRGGGCELAKKSDARLLDAMIALADPFGLANK